MSSRSVSVRDIKLFLFRPILRTATLRNDEAGRISRIPTLQGDGKEQAIKNPRLSGGLKCLLTISKQFLDHNR